MTRKKNEPYSQLKGVAALLEQASPPSSVLNIEITRVIPSHFQPRYYFDPDQHLQLVASIRSYGILEPLLVRPTPTGQYEIIAGERRYRAALAANLLQIPVIVQSLNDQEALHIALLENLQRSDLSPLEETDGILSLLATELGYPKTTVISLLYRMQNEAKGKVTQNVLGNSEGQKIMAVFQAIGTITWESFVSSRLPLLKLPSDILEALRQGKIEYTKAKAIAKVKDEEARTALLSAAIEDSLSLSEIKARITALKPSPDVTSPLNRLQTATRRLNQLKLWEKDKKTWKKVEGWLGKIETLLAEVEPEEPMPVGITSESLAEIFEDIPVE